MRTVRRRSLVHDDRLSIWLITVGEPLPFGRSAAARPWRTGLLADLLVARGHDVTWWTSSVDHFSKTLFVDSPRKVQTASGLALQFLHGCLYTKNISFARLRNHRQIAKQFAVQGPTQLPPDVILCSYPTIELSAEAVRYGASRSIPVLLDIRDLWPDEMTARLPRPLRPLARLIFPRMHRDAAYALRGAAGLIAISTRYLEWGLRHARRLKNVNDAVFTHGYPVPEKKRICSDTVQWLSGLGIEKSKRIFWFVGTFVGSIDLSTVIEAARRLVDRPDVQFVFTGSGERDSEWREQAKGLANVVFTGWCDAQQVGTLASIAWAGLGAYKRDALMSLTNKVFEYLAHGLPILLSLGGEAREIVEGAGCGVFYEPEAAESLESAVRRLSEDQALRDRMARCARQTFEERFSASMVYGRMADHLEARTRQFRPQDARGPG
jgi:glycosyltransferase involved in cell wall biosynthesis